MDDDLVKRITALERVQDKTKLSTKIMNKIQYWSYDGNVQGGEGTLIRSKNIALSLVAEADRVYSAA